MFNSSLYGESDAYILVKVTISVANIVAEDNDAYNTNKIVKFNNLAPFISCKIEINNTDHAKDVVVAISMHNLIEYKDNYSEISGDLWQFYRDRAAVDNNDAIIDFTNEVTTGSFKRKEKIAVQTGNNGAKNTEIMTPLK